MTCLLFYSEAQMRLAQEDPAALEKARQALEEIRARQPGQHRGDGNARTDLSWRVSTRRGSGGIQGSPQQTIGEPNGVFAPDRFPDASRDRPAQAEKAMQEVLDVDAGFTRARLSLAQAQSERGDHAGAARTLEEGPKEVLTDPEVRTTARIRAPSVGSVRPSPSTRSRRCWRRIQAISRIAISRAMSLAAMGREDEAIVVTRDLLREPPNEPGSRESCWLACWRAVKSRRPLRRR